MSATDVGKVRKDRRGVNRDFRGDRGRFCRDRWMNENEDCDYAPAQELQPPAWTRPPPILLRKIKLTETSLIVTWFTEAHARLRQWQRARASRRALCGSARPLLRLRNPVCAKPEERSATYCGESVLRNPHEGLRLDLCA